MKALTLTQPWASLVAAGIKRWETRSWSGNPGGRLAIHAAKGFPAYARGFALGCRECQGLPYYKDLPLGQVIALCEVKRIVRTDNFPPPTEIEGRLGDWRPGRFAWELANVIPIGPVPATGALQFWRWDERQDPIANRLIAEDLVDIINITVGEEIPLETVMGWDLAQRDQVGAWAARELESATAGEYGVRGPARRPRPDFLPPPVRL